jgi:ribonuclease P protein component
MGKPQMPEAHGSSADETRRYRFPRRMRVLNRADFERALRSGPRATDKRLTLWAVPNGRPYPRLGLIVSRRHGDAVTRNRIKRLLRSAFRLSQHDLPRGLDLICSPRAGVRPDLRGCQDSLLLLATRLARQIEKGRRGGPPQDQS